MLRASYVWKGEEGPMLMRGRSEGVKKGFVLGGGGFIID